MAADAKSMILSLLLAAGLSRAAEVPVAVSSAPVAVSTAPVSVSTQTAPAPPAEPKGLLPPKPPEHVKRDLSTASEVALDLASTLAFLEAGKVYYKAYAQGTHSAEENKAFLAFLQDYERELGTAKGEFDVLQAWLGKKSGLKD